MCVHVCKTQFEILLEIYQLFLIWSYFRRFEDNILLLDTSTDSARRLASMGLVVVDYLLTVASTAATWSTSEFRRGRHLRKWKPSPKQPIWKQHPCIHFIHLATPEALDHSWLFSIVTPDALCCLLVMASESDSQTSGCCPLHQRPWLRVLTRPWAIATSRSQWTASKTFLFWQFCW